MPHYPFLERERRRECTGKKEGEGIREERVGKSHLYTKEKGDLVAQESIWHPVMKGGEKKK